jgi:hypothetical protein
MDMQGRILHVFLSFFFGISIALSKEIKLRKTKKKIENKWED